jgi:hypothetical protein
MSNTQTPTSCLKLQAATPKPPQVASNILATENWWDKALNWPSSSEHQRQLIIIILILSKGQEERHEI